MEYRTRSKDEIKIFAGAELITLASGKDAEDVKKTRPLTSSGLVMAAADNGFMKTEYQHSICQNNSIIYVIQYLQYFSLGCYLSYLSEVLGYITYTFHCLPPETPLKNNDTSIETHRHHTTKYCRLGEGGSY